MHMYVCMYVCAVYTEYFNSSSSIKFVSFVFIRDKSQ